MLDKRSKYLNYFTNRGSEGYDEKFTALEDKEK